MTKRIAHMAGVVLLFVAIFAFYEPVLLRNPQNTISDVGDGLLNFWMLSRGLENLSSANLASFWHGNLFHPFAYTMALSDTLLFQVLLLLPFDLLGVPRLTLFNLSIVVFFVLFGTANYALLHKLSKGRVELSLLGSVLASVNLYWFAHISHYQLLATFWYPVILRFWWCFGTTKRLGYWIALSVCYLGLALSSPYLFVLFLPVTVVLILVMWRLDFRSFQYQAKLGLVFLPVIIAIGGFYWPYIQVKDWYGLVRNMGEQALYSATWEGFSHQGGLQFWQWLRGPLEFNGEKHVYIGIVPKLLLFAGLIVLAGKLIKHRKSPVRVAPDYNYKWFYLAVALSLGLMLMSLGPQDKSLGSVNLWKLFSWIPGFSGIRVPGRLGYQIHIFVALAVITLWIKHLKSENNVSKVLWLALAVIHIIEMRPAKDPNQPPTSLDFVRTAPLREFLHKVRENESFNAPVLMLPLREHTERLKLAATTPLRFVGGRSGYIPDISEKFFFPILEDCDGSLCLNLLKDLHVAHVLIDKKTSEIDRVPFFLHHGFVTLFEDADFHLLRSHTSPRTHITDDADAADAAADALAASRIVGNEDYLTRFPPDMKQATQHANFVLLSSHNNDSISYATDGNLETRWSTNERQQAPQQLTITFATPLTSPGLLVFDHGPESVMVSDYLRNPTITLLASNQKPVSSNLRTQLYRHQGRLIHWIAFEPASPSLEGGVTSIQLQANEAMWSGNWWSINELKVYICSADCGWF